jgi:Xaa-Pro aminopeptidase
MMQRSVTLIFEFFILTFDFCYFGYFAAIEKFVCMKNLPLNPGLFVANRKRFTEKMKPNSIAIFVSNDEVPSNGDALYTFKQNSDLFWLTGIRQEDTMVVLFPDNPDKKYREVLVLVRPNELKEKWDGKRHRRKKPRLSAVSQPSFGLIALMP